MLDDSERVEMGNANRAIAGRDQTIILRNNATYTAQHSRQESIPQRDIAITSPF